MEKKRDWKEWAKAALIRAFRTFCQGLLTAIGSNAIKIVDIDWITALEMSATMAVVSLLMSVVTGLPEAPDKEEV